MSDGILAELEEFEGLVNDFIKGLTEEAYISQHLRNLKQNVFSKYGARAPNNISTTLIALEKKFLSHKNTKNRPKFRSLYVVPKGIQRQSAAPLKAEAARSKTFEISLGGIKIISQRNENVVVTGGEATSAPVTLEELDTCNIEIMEAVSTSYINKVSNCNILIGPCSGSVMIYEATECTFKLACKQLRVHDSVNVILLANSFSAPIIENCKGIGYNKYKFTYEDYKNQLKIAKLESVEEIDRHEITDFSWQKQAPSPNWSILEE